MPPHWSSRLLDVFSVVHYLSGNVIELPKQKLLVEEACSGINSVLLTLAVCLFYLLWRRRSVVRILICLPCALATVLLGNVFRITLGAWLKFYYGIDILSGWRHESLGLLLVALYMVMILSLDEWMNFLTFPLRQRFAIALASTKPAVTQAFYSSLAARALATGDFQTARVAGNRLLLSWPGARGQDMFNLGLALFGLGQAQEGSALINVAALEKPGYAPAHLFIARQLLMQTNVTPAMLQQAERHLTQALEVEPNSVEAHLVLGRLYFQMRNWAAAKDHLEAVVSARLETAILLASAAKAEKDNIGVRRWADRAAEYFRGKIEKTKQENPMDRLAWATALAIQERYAEAIGVLDAGRKKADSKVYASGMASIYADWAAQAAKTDPHNVALRLKLIQQGLECDPNNLPLLELLLPLTHLSGAEAKDAEAMLTRMLAEGGSSAMLHFVLGNDAFQRGNTALAHKHFKLAFELGPNLPVVANMMALMLAIGKEPDLPRALAISKTVVEKYPNEPDVRNTHGTILVKLGQWEEAVKDLEFALPKLRIKGPTHASLALAYRNLGLSDAANEHERLAREPSALAAPNPSP